MMPSHRRLSFWALQAVGSTGLYVLAVVASAADLRARGVWRGITVFVATLAGLSIALRFAYRRWWNPSRTWHSLGAMSAAGSAVAALAAATFPFRLLVAERPADWSSWPFDVTECFVVLFLWSTLYFGIKIYRHATLERERALVAESEVRRAQLLALRAQLNPHFLFNALNGLSTLILERENSRANEMLGQIAALLRASLEDEGAAEVPLESELAFVERYVAVERARLERLRYRTSVDEDVRRALVPTMLLQPLVENAVHHGIALSAAPGVVRLRAVSASGSLRITIDNPVAHCPPATSRAAGSACRTPATASQRYTARTPGSRPRCATDRSLCRFACRFASPKRASHARPDHRR